MRIPGLSVDGARARVASGSPDEVLAIPGSLALVARDGSKVRMAASLFGPMFARQDGRPKAAEEDDENEEEP